MTHIRLVTMGIAATIATTLIGLTSAAGSTPPPGWSAVTLVPGTVGVANPVPATTPDGTDVVAWLAPDTGGTEIDAKVRRPGAATWRTVTPRIVHQPDVEGLLIAPAPDGSIWALWETYNGTPQVFVNRLDPAKRTWTAPVQVFSEAGYGHTVSGITVAGDGTVGVVAEANAVPATDPPTYRAVVGLRHPGGHWTTKALTPADDFASDPAIAANAAGQFVVSWIQGYALGTEVVHAAVHTASTANDWKPDVLSNVGDTQRAHVAIGLDGTAAVAWAGPASGAGTFAELATTKVTNGAPDWTRRDLVTATSNEGDAYPAVARDGSVTAVWQEVPTSTTTTIWMSTLSHDTLSAPVQVSADGNRSEIDAIAARPDGKIALLYRLLTPLPTQANEGLRYRKVTDGTPGPEITLTDATDGSVNSVALGLNAASRNNIVFDNGDFPADQFATIGDQATDPIAMVDPFTGTVERHAAVTGTRKGGHTVRCAVGLWVEARTLTYAWTLGGKPVAHHTHRTLHLKPSAAGKRLSCRITASNAAGGRTTLRSKAKKVS